MSVHSRDFNIVLWDAFARTNANDTKNRYKKEYIENTGALSDVGREPEEGTPATPGSIPVGASGPMSDEKNTIEPLFDSPQNAAWKLEHKYIVYFLVMSVTEFKKLLIPLESENDTFRKDDWTLFTLNKCRVMLLEAFDIVCNNAVRLTQGDKSRVDYILDRVLFVLGSYGKTDEGNKVFCTTLSENIVSACNLNKENSMDVSVEDNVNWNTQNDLLPSETCVKICSNMDELAKSVAYKERGGVIIKTATDIFTDYTPSLSYTYWRVVKETVLSCVTLQMNKVAFEHRTAYTKIMTQLENNTLALSYNAQLYYNVFTAACVYFPYIHKPVVKKIEPTMSYKIAEQFVLGGTRCSINKVCTQCLHSSQVTLERVPVVYSKIISQLSETCVKCYTLMDFNIPDIPVLIHIILEKAIDTQHIHKRIAISDVQYHILVAVNTNNVDDDYSCYAPILKDDPEEGQINSLIYFSLAPEKDPSLKSTGSTLSNLAVQYSARVLEVGRLQKQVIRLAATQYMNTYKGNEHVAKQIGLQIKEIVHNSAEEERLCLLEKITRASMASMTQAIKDLAVSVESRLQKMNSIPGYEEDCDGVVLPLNQRNPYVLFCDSCRNIEKEIQKKLKSKPNEKVTVDTCMVHSHLVDSITSVMNIGRNKVGGRFLYTFIAA